ncbi:MAG TPA: metallophosphoesterase family protein [Polyangia bacterium]|nr:metallophosphoesterase family protein [Polyangia bacterium]
MRSRRAVCALALAGLGALGCKRAERLMGVDAGSAVAPVGPAEDETQVHFTFTGPTSVTFDWHGTGRALRIWSKTMPPRQILARDANPKPLSGPGPWKEATVNDLQPGTEYGYEVGHPRFPVPAFFSTPPAPGASSGFAFAALAGVGSSLDFSEAAPVHRLISLGDPAFVLGLGDLTFGDIRTQASVDRHFDDVMAWSRTAAYMPVWGEHEWSSRRDDLRNYKGRFALPHAQESPGAPKAGCCGEDWYWFDYGNVRFISYPEPYTDATWDDWAAKATPLFEQAENDPAITFTITMGHHPAFSSAREGGDPRLRRLLNGFGTRFRKYVLDLSGHAGAYERTKPIAHVVHVVTGPAAGELDHADTPCFWQDCTAPDFTARRAIHHAFLRVAVRPNAVKVDAFCGLTAPGRDDIHCAEGDIFDTVTIEAPPTPRAGPPTALQGEPARRSRASDR